MAGHQFSTKRHDEPSINAMRCLPYNAPRTIQTRFVAVKTRVANKSGVEPRPGMRKARPQLPPGSSFSGHVQAMGFRFEVDEPVIPMRLSTFNVGETRQIIYALTRRPKRVRGTPKSMVRRQIPGRILFNNLTGPLPLRIVGGGIDDLMRNSWALSRVRGRRDPEPHNGLARELFASDLLAARQHRLSHAHEEREKIYLDIGEHLGLRGPANDRLIGEAIASEREEILCNALNGVRAMTLTVVDGDLPRALVRDTNLELLTWRMGRSDNSRERYHGPDLGPRAKPRGVRWQGPLPSSAKPR